MGCIYTHEDLKRENIKHDKVLRQFKSMEDLLNALTSSGVSTHSQLEAYHFDLESALQKNDGAIAFTDWYNTVMGRNAQQSSPSFESKRGTFIHNYISKRLTKEISEEGLTDDEKLEINNKIINKFPITDTEWTDIAKWQSVCQTALRDIKDQIPANAEIILTEQPIYYKDDSINIKATPDLIFKTKEQGALGDEFTYHVIDYKITAADIEGSPQYVAQLNFIETILKKHGAGKIQKANWVILPTNGHISVQNKNKSTTKDPKVNEALSKLRPIKKMESVVINTENVRKFEDLKEKIEKNRSSITQNKTAYINYLKKVVVNYKNVYYNGYLYNYSEDKNGKIILSKEKFDNIEFNNFELFAEASYTYNNSNHISTISNIIGHLNEGSNLQEVFESYDPGIKNAFIANIGKYSGSSWKVIQLGDLTNKYGIILIQNINNGTYDIVKFSNVEHFQFNMGAHSNGFFSKALNDQIREGGSFLLDNLIPREITLQYEQKTPDATLGNIELFELFTALSLIKENLGDIKIGKIEVVSTINGTHVHTDSQNFELFENAFKILQQNIDKSSLTSDEGLSFFTDYQKVSQEQLLMDDITLLLRDIGRDWSGYSIDKDGILAKKTALNDILKKLESNPSTKDLEVTKAVTNLLVYLDQITPDKVQEVVKYGIGDVNSLFGPWFDAMFNDSIRLSNAVGEASPGISGGVMHIASYQSPDDIIRKTTRKRDIIINGFVQKTIAETQELKNATEIFLNVNNQNNFFGKFHDDEEIYKPLFKHVNGEISPDMMFKNPYFKDSENSLTQEQSDYLEVVLFTINKHRGMSLLRGRTFAELKADTSLYQKYQDAISNNPESYLAIPLKLKKGVRGNVNRLKNSWTKSDIKSWWKDTVSNMFAIVDPNVVTAKQLAEKRQALKKQEEIPSMYPNNIKNRTDMCHAHQPAEFIMNLNYLGVDFVFDSLKRNALNQYLETTKTVAHYLAFTELTTGLDLSAQKEALISDTTINIFLDDISEKEFKPALAANNMIKKVKSYVSLGFRPALFFKEEVLGLIKNFSHTAAKWIQSEYPITAKHLTKAYKIVIPSNWWEDGIKKTFGAKSRADLSIVTLLNQRWRIHGQDLSMYPESLTIHKTIWNFDSGLAYTNVTAPDNDNRMVLIVAKMLADGTFNAFEIKNKQLVYNPAKDERFSYFFANRNNDKNMLSDKKYVQQKSLYEYYITAFNDSGQSVAYSKDPKNWGMIPDPYTTQQLNSLKEQIGMMYGFYNHEERDYAAFASYKRWYMQFMTWLPGELRRYFASGTESSVGKVTHLTDVEGKLLYWKRLSDGTRVKITESVDENGNQLEPVYGWQAHPVVGLFISFSKILHHGIKGDFAWFKEPNHKYLIRNAGLCLFHMIFGIIISKILASLISDSKKHKEKYSTEAIMAIELGQKVFNELNFVNNIASATDSLNLLTVNYLKDVFADVGRTIGNENYNMLDFVNDNISAFRDFHLDD